jgi:hypothetical protein
LVIIIIQEQLCLAPSITFLMDNLEQSIHGFDHLLYIIYKMLASSFDMSYFSLPESHISAKSSRMSMWSGCCSILRSKSFFLSKISIYVTTKVVQKVENHCPGGVHKQACI